MRNSIVEALKVGVPACLVVAFVFGDELCGESRGWLGALDREIIAVSNDPATQWAVVVCLAYYLGILFILERRSFRRNNGHYFGAANLWLAGLVAVVLLGFALAYGRASDSTEVLVLLSGIIVGKAISVWACLQKNENERRTAWLIGLLVCLLAGAALWQPEATPLSRYHGTHRWGGVWDDPNPYGLLMGTGMVLAIGLLAARLKTEGKRLEVTPIVLYIAAIMLGAGLVFSYSRGAWAAITIGMLYLAKVYGKFKWRYILPAVFIMAAVVWIFWNTPQTSPWYLQRLDFGRGSVQHRFAAWKAGFAIMRDHPFGVGWNMTVDVYRKDYSAPEGGAEAITTNDYLMLGTQLGVPALVCFAAYVALCFRSQKSEVRSQKSAGERAEGRKQTAESGQSGIRNSEFAIGAACRAGALAMLVAFWFDGGLFKLATTSVFWILLELGAAAPPHKTNLARANQ